jgi:hypothetical protein
MTCDEFRKLALSLPEAVESAHMNHPDFRVRRKIFATLWPDQNLGVVMLKPEQQASLITRAPTTFEPVTGGWGKRGATTVYLDSADERMVSEALLIAWRNAAPRSLLDA